VLGLLGDVVVSRDDRRHHGAGVAEGLLHRARGTDGAVQCVRGHAGLLLATELTEELVHVADDTHCCHVWPSLGSGFTIT